MSTIPVHIPARVWGQLVAVAERQDVKVGDLLAAAVMELAGWERRAQRVQVLARAGLPDVVIAERTGETRGFIHGARRTAGIPAQQFRRTA